MNKILVVDNYDSFTYNLVQLIHEITGALPHVYRNDQITPVESSTYEKILLSPGPGIPDEAGNLKGIIKQCMYNSSILGVCLGMQAIAEVFGGKISNLERVYHGVAKEVQQTSQYEPLFRGLPVRFNAARYHSWVVSNKELPNCLTVTASDRQKNIMAIRHTNYQVAGVQFHPESILTKYGKAIMENWLLQ